eukprot:TRINITY_DN64476_c0_g1_i1.p1 TRINITY_DN64476_c0_g1~~TRINITY_DN64476_c0_g1_i1.p1  ORF type:complete len:405 (-),score=73.78 TRINITY_DN64476_c0_g1_i1:152-1366(-)
MPVRAGRSLVIAAFVQTAQAALDYRTLEDRYLQHQVREGSTKERGSAKSAGSQHDAFLSANSAADGLQFGRGRRNITSFLTLGTANSVAPKKESLPVASALAPSKPEEVLTTHVEMMRANDSRAAPAYVAMVGQSGNRGSRSASQEGSIGINQIAPFRRGRLEAASSPEARPLWKSRSNATIPLEATTNAADSAPRIGGRGDEESVQPIDSVEQPAGVSRLGNSSVLTIASTFAFRKTNSTADSIAVVNSSQDRDLDIAANLTEEILRLKDSDSDASLMAEEMDDGEMVDVTRGEMVKDDKDEEDAEEEESDEEADPKNRQSYIDGATRESAAFAFDGQPDAAARRSSFTTMVHTWSIHLGVLLVGMGVVVLIVLSNAEVIAASAAYRVQRLLGIFTRSSRLVG